MAHPLTLPTLAVLAVAGSGFGVYLGRAAIAEIDPAYYSEPETRFHTDLAPSRPSTYAAVYRAGQLSTAELDQALGRGCVGCRTYPEEYFPQQDPAVEPYRDEGDSAQQPPPPQAAASAPEPVDEERAAEFAAVERYSSYPITAEAASEEAPAAELELTLVTAAID